MILWVCIEVTNKSDEHNVEEKKISLFGRI